ncbi:DUF397 domain-containing protein [Streptomyces sp. NPDC059037]|uniref:DUF397 domain-containing protein n=1 Tax=Streptomyces sp. NPDC059037 TaxID=3346710 RepID=UPI00369D43C0
MSDALKWFKSSFSGPEGDACLEAALEWRKSTYSEGDRDACVEAAVCPVAVHIRDSKLPAWAGPELTIPAPAWKAFISAVQPGA